MATASSMCDGSSPWVSSSNTFPIVLADSDIQPPANAAVVDELDASKPTVV
jgi:hypothetical protein